MQDGLILCRFVHFGAVLLLFGIGLFRTVLFTTSLQAFEASSARRSLDRTIAWLAGASLLSALTWLMLTAASMAGEWRAAGDPQTIMLVLAHTFFGHVWTLHLALNLALLFSLRWLHVAPYPALLLNALLVLTLAPVGHGAMYDGTQGQLLIANQVLHLTGVGTWLGGLFMLAVLLIGREAVDLRAVLSRFSGIGYGLVALIVITGMINVRALSGGLWPEPALSGFGLVLAVKLAIVLGMLALAATNRALSRARHLRMPVLRTCVVLECLLGGAALAAVSLLGTLPPILT